MFSQFLTGFPENAKNIYILKVYVTSNTNKRFKGSTSGKKVENHCVRETEWERDDDETLWGKCSAF